MAHSDTEGRVEQIEFISDMNKWVYLTVFVCMLSTTKAFAQYEGTFGGGVHLAYAGEFKSPGAGIYLHYNITDRMRLAPAWTYFLERKGTKTWMAEADVHYLVPVTWEFSFYPLGGFNFERFRNDPGLNAKNSSRLGANVGLGLQYDIQYHVTVHVEGKYQFIKDYSQPLFMAGIGYWF